jgi:hypothetical protein
MKTDWELEFVEPEVTERSNDFDLEEFGGILWQRKRDVGYRFAYPGPLAIFPLPPRHPSKKKPILTKHREALRFLYGKYGESLFSYKEVRQQVTSLTLGILWAHGYLEKLGLGEYNLSGKPYGVHYRIIKCL